jgi:ribosomal protein L11 methyltransferase
LDYGCGSGILSIAALHMGAARCVGVDVDRRWWHPSGMCTSMVYSEATLRIAPAKWYRVRSVYAGGVDVCVANILIEQLCRASMVAAIVSNMVPGACCVFRAFDDEVDSLKAAYADHMEWLDDQYVGR